MYDDDLTHVVRHVHRRTTEMSRRLANSPLTRAYLEAGVRLLRREFTDVPKPVDDGFVRPLASLTRQAVIAEVANGPRELPLRGTPGSFRDRWAYFSDYLSDLARYTLRMKRWSPYELLAGEAIPELPEHGSFSAAVHEHHFRLMQLATASTGLRFRVLAAALADHDESLREALASAYQELTTTWAKVSAKVANRHGVAPRPGITFEELTVILIAVVEGLAVRMAGDPAALVMDHQRRRTLLGKAALALYVGCVDTGDGSSLEDAADRIARPDPG